MTTRTTIRASRSSKHIPSSQGSAKKRSSSNEASTSSSKRPRHGSFLRTARTVVLTVACFGAGLLLAGIISTPGADEEPAAAETVEFASTATGETPVRVLVREIPTVDPTTPTLPAPSSAPGSGEGAGVDGPDTTEEPAAGSGASALDTLEETFLDRDRQDAREMLAMKEWDDFYSVVGALRLPESEREALILRRLESELSLTGDERRALQRILRTEQETVTRVALERFGRHLTEMADLDPDTQRSLWTELRSLRQVVRGDFDTRYAEVLDDSRRETFDAHLRNDRIRLYQTFRPDGEFILVTGVGH